MHVSKQLVIRAWPHGAIEGVLWSWLISVLKKVCLEKSPKCIEHRNIGQLLLEGRRKLVVLKVRVTHTHKCRRHIS